MLKNKSIYISPAFLSAYVLFISLGVNIFLLESSVGPGHFLYIFGFLVFIFSFFVVQLVFTSKVDFPISPVVLRNKRLILIYWFLGFLGLLGSLYKIYNVGLSGDLDRFFFYLRYEHTIDRTMTYYGEQHLSLFSIALAYYYSLVGNMKKAYLLLLMYVTSAISAAERTSIFFAFSSFFYLLYISGRIKKTGLFIAFPVLIGVFVLIAVSAGKTGGGGNFDFILQYVGYSISALNEYVYGRSFEGCLNMVLGIFSKLIPYDEGRCFGLIDYLDDKDRFNVYSYVSAPYLFAGWPGVFVFMSFLGGWYSVLWTLGKSRGGYFAVLLSIYVYAVGMMFYAWQFSLTTYVYLIIILYPLFYKFRFSIRA